MMDVPNRLARMTPWIELTRFWSELEPQSQSALMSEATIAEVRGGEYANIEFGLVISGTCGLEYLVGNGRRSIAELFHSGDLIDMSRHERAPQGRLVALGHCSVLTMPVDDFELCARHHSDILRAYRRQMEDQVGRLRDHVNDLATKTPLERIVSILFELRRWPEASVSKAAEIALPLLRKDIAAYAGIKAETVSRALRRLTDAKLIKPETAERETIALLDPPRLRQIANGGAPRGLGLSGDD